MISQQALFTQMDLKLQQAKAAQTEAQMREALSALQALCDVVLHSADSVTVHAIQQQQELSPMMQPKSTQLALTQNQATKFDDANGSSIFDF